MSQTLNEKTLKLACVELASKHLFFRDVFNQFGTPPLWERPPGFATLVHIILEQQVSLASAKACFDKLNAYLGRLTPENLLALNDTELRSLGFSRQKTAYTRNLAEKLIDGSIDLQKIELLDDNDAKAELMKLKGVGNWTADIYLLMAMLRPDVMPRGDLALHVAWQRLSKADSRPDSDQFIKIAETWAPHRSAAARLLWHFYLSNGKK